MGSLWKLFAKSENGRCPETFEAARILSEAEFRRIITNERERANRNQHIVSLVLFEISPLDKPVGNTKDFEELIRVITLRKRNVDEIGWYDKCHLALTLPYTSRAGALSFIQSVFKAIGSRCPRPVCDVYTYPSDRDKIEWRQ